MNKDQLTRVSREGRISISEDVDVKEYSRWDVREKVDFLKCESEQVCFSRHRES